MKIIQMFKNYTLSEIGNKAPKKIRLALYHQIDKKSIKRKTVLTGNKVLAVTRCSDLSELITMLVCNSRGYRPKEYGRTLDERTIIRYADSICQGRMEILGRYTDFLEGIKWHSDFTCGYAWDSTLYHTDIKFGNCPGADIKMPWELGRMQFLYPVMNAYNLTCDKRYLNYVTSTLQDWIAKNTAKRGSGWACTMDAGIRAANLCIIYSWLQQQQALDEELALKIFSLLYGHADYIAHNLEYDSGLTTNHYLADILGLLYIGAFFPEFKKSDEWIAYSLQELISEMKRQVHEEGTDFEASTCYHCLVTEMFLSASILVRNLEPKRRLRIKAYDCRGFKPLVGPKLKPLGQQEFNLDDPQVFPAWHMSRLEKMLEFIMHITKADGKIPQIGDNDNGRLHKFTLIGQWNPESDRFEEDLLDYRHLLAVGGAAFKRADFREIGLPYQSECLWYGYEDGVEDISGSEEAEQHSLNSLRKLSSQAYPQFGLYIMRHEDNYMAIRCGDIGQNGQGGHAHNDQLSFVLNVGGEEIFVDPGTYVYSSSSRWRNYFRSTACHNTLMVVGEEQNRFDGSNLFKLLNDSHSQCLRWEPGESIDLFEGEHFSCQQSNINTHRRNIIFDKEACRWTITDSIEGKAPRLMWSFIINPEIDLWVDNNQILLLTSKSKTICLKYNLPHQVTFKRIWYSPKYGKKINTSGIRFSVSDQLNNKTQAEEFTAVIDVKP